MIETFIEIGGEVICIETPVHNAVSIMVEGPAAASISIAPTEAQQMRPDRPHGIKGVPVNTEYSFGPRPYPGYGNPLVWAASNVLAQTVGRYSPKGKYSPFYSEQY